MAKRLYSLDTLDTRFTTSSRPPPRDKRLRIDPAQPSSGRTVSGEDEKESKTVVERSSDASPSRWRTPEFFVYYFALITIVPMMFKVTYDVSKGSTLLITATICPYFLVSVDNSMRTLLIKYRNRIPSELLQLRSLTFTWVDPRT